MKPLLFDQNLSPRLVRRLEDIYPGSAHVAYLGLGNAADKEIWEYARAHGYIAVTKDADFGEFSVVWGFPPQVIWIRRGNCSTNDIESILRDNFDIIVKFSDDSPTGVLTLY